AMVVEAVGEAGTEPEAARQKSRPRPRHGAVYQEAGGQKRSPMPDFSIGGHAAAAGYRLLTRDAARFRTYFLTVQLIPPES
ncbi:hypothetical protein U9R90_36125, partial [Streptomyces sp. E11-3]